MKTTPKYLYKLSKAPNDFIWAGRVAPEIPILCDLDGTVWEPAALFFGSSFWYSRVKISSMQDEAYILREWKIYLDDRNIPWDAVSDQVMVEWREHLKKLGTNQNTRINRKLEFIFSFYEKANFYGFMETDPVSPSGPITCLDQQLLQTAKRGSHGKQKTNSRVWACAEKSSTTSRKRPTPDTKGVKAILANLRDSRKNSKTGMRDWFIARLMSEAGLRNHEVRNLTITALENALKQANISIPEPTSYETATKQGWKNKKYALDSISEWREGQNKLLENIAYQRINKNLNYIYVHVTGKGDKERYAPFPLDLVVDLLETGIWHIRQQQSYQWNTKVLPAEILLSNRQKPLERKTITNLLKTAFNETEIDGSGHRLRAYFATNYSEQLWIKYLKMNMFRWDQTVENQILHELTEAMGHSEATTTIRHYLDLGRAAYLDSGGNPKMRAMRKVAEAMINHSEKTAPELLKILEQIINVHDSMPNDQDQNLFRDTLREMLSIYTTYGRNDPDNEGAKTTKPYLRLVDDS
nr:site-specific integrase [uncultured Cohaesibacter sp.]